MIWTLWILLSKNCEFQRYGVLKISVIFYLSHMTPRFRNWPCFMSQKEGISLGTLRDGGGANLCDLLSPLWWRIEKKLRSSSFSMSLDSTGGFFLQVPLSSSHGRWHRTALPFEVLQNGHVCPWYRQSRILRQKWTSLCIRPRGKWSQTSRLRHQVCKLAA